VAAMAVLKRTLSIGRKNANAKIAAIQISIFNSFLSSMTVEKLRFKKEIPHFASLHSE
jgi:hypothetical protein